MLNDLLSQVDDRHQRLLALDFAEHVVERFGDRTDRDNLPHCLELLAALTEALALGKAHERLIAAWREHARLVVASGRESDDMRDVVRSAVEASSWDLLAEAGIAGSHTMRRRLSCVSVAREARRAVGRCVGGAAEDVRAARWEEARWQVGRVVETAPCPQGRDSR
ncbi:hypothetical protein [Streptomyces triticirhizae]|uniref:Uncharacterized protein n=1 Tax=Streptomyces triticirhizae TaxID=2483353 RepID=A0A3M2M1Z3_9ACTN|nr:hypothetical protein [Streptomyces triticirhizae]RMI43556.1 hypothetical protein EBN88_07050 [Streptomyces triticirhizae]